MDATRTATLAGQLTDGHTYTITAKATDAAGNTGTTTRTFVYDTTAPTVTNVTSTKADGAYPAGTLIPITVTFSETVAVTGTPTLALNSGGTATYSSGSGSVDAHLRLHGRRRRELARPRLHGHELARARRRHDQGRRHQQRRRSPSRPSAARTRSAARRTSSSTRPGRPSRTSPRRRPTAPTRPAR